jgi:hypothetical protein
MELPSRLGAATARAWPTADEERPNGGGDNGMEGAVAGWVR